MSTKCIINADDFGKTNEINKAIIESKSIGLVTDTSIMATVSASFEDACKYLKEGYFDTIGAHLCITHGKPVCEEMAHNSLFCDSSGCFKKINSKLFGFFLRKKDRTVLLKEFDAQIKKIKDAGFAISHADTHQHIHYRFAILKVVIQCCKDNDIPFLRLCCLEGKSFFKRIKAKWINHTIKRSGLHFVDGFFDFNTIEKANSGIVEFMCHPCYNKKGVLIDKIKKLDIDECDTLEKHTFYARNQLKLISFEEIKTK